MMASVALRISAGLLFLVMTVAPWAAVSAYSPSSASGSASGDTTEPECKPPPSSNPSGIRVNLTDEQWQELLLEGRCYLACATEKYQVEYDYVIKKKNTTILSYLVGMGANFFMIDIEHE
jgi:hypothetical protein